MKFKINTKEKFKEIHLIDPELTAIMTDELVNMLNSGINTEPKNVILSLKECKTMENSFAEALTGLQTKYYDNGASFVLCELNPTLEEALDEAGILETMNIAPTLSEAWDLVQMEEIERELLSDWE
jgi:anti-anti-sigma regulatory factor